MSIQEIVLKIKSWVGDEAWERLENGTKWLILALSGVCILITGFCLGTLNQQKSTLSTEPIQVIYPPQPATTCEITRDSRMQTTPSDTLKTVGGDYVGSKSGKTYYTKDCKGINRIKPENRVYFSTSAEAQARGYTLSKTYSSH